VTAIVCFNWNHGAVFIADSRLSYPGPSGQIVTVRDVCQKLWVPNGWSVLGFAGDLCLGNALAGAFFTTLKDKKWARNHLLTADDAMRELILSTLATHPDELGDGHAQCLAKPAALLFAYVGLVANNDEHGKFDHYELGTFTVSITSVGDIERSGFGAAVLGEGAEAIKPELTPKRLTDIANARDDGSRSLFALLVTSRLIDKYKAKSAGLPLQIVQLSPKGVEIMPYFYWVDITNRFGTYVAMRIENGDWVQEHRPTKTKRRMKRPFEVLNQEIDEGEWPLDKAEMFDPRETLTNQSPGVIRKQNPHLVYATYKPPNVPQPVIESWGPEPIEMLTWASDSDASSD
jgi:hypothetical protein